jgi:hypothetical protein
LLNYITENGNPNVPATKHSIELPSGRKLDLSRWCVKQRLAYDKGNLLPERLEKLNSINFDWTGDLAPKKKKFRLNDEDFDKRLNLLAQWSVINGHANVPQNEYFEGEQLGTIVSWWRQSYFGKGRTPLSRTQIQKIEAVHPTWLWSAADLRDGVANPISDKNALELLEIRKGHEINRAIQYGLFGGLRLFDATHFEVKQQHGILCFYLPKRSGYQERYVPVHHSILEIKQATSTAQSLGILFKRLHRLNQQAKEDRLIFFSLHMTFRVKLKELGLDSKIINGLSGYNPRMNWSKENLILIKAAIDKITYSS